MVTPLQVTILYLIVDTGGSAPTARWSLFSEYFEVLKRREKAKGGEIQRVIELNWNHLGPIHQAAGLILQTKSEIEGGAGSKFDKLGFQEVLEAHFQNAGFFGEELKLRVMELLDLSLNRLVLLASKEEGFIGFDVRSLQEFMAAAALTSGELGEVEERLQHIAGIAHWRHVWLIAASRCFADDGFHHRRLAIIALPRALDANPEDQLVYNGARLALELFIDGIGIDHPMTRMALAKHAIEILGFGRAAIEEDLGKIWENSTKEIILSALTRALAFSGDSSWRGAWGLICALEGIGEMNPIIESHWPTEAKYAKWIVEKMQDPPQNIILKDKVLVAIKSLNEIDAIKTISKSTNEEEVKQWNDLIESNIIRGDAKDRGIYVLNSAANRFLSIEFESISNKGLYQNWRDISKNAPGWINLRIASLFGLNPNNLSLSVVLAELASMNNLNEIKKCVTLMPWPLASLIDAAQTQEDLIKFSDLAKSGKLGNIEDWQKAELRWQKNGISLEDLTHEGKESPYDAHISFIGLPIFRQFRVSMVELRGLDALIQLAHAAVNAKSRRRKSDISFAMVFSTVGMYQGQSSIDVDIARLLMQAVEGHKFSCYLTFFNLFAPILLGNGDVVSAVSKLSERGIIFPARQPYSGLSSYILAINQYSEEKGLLPIILGMMSSIEDEAEITSLPEIKLDFIVVKTNDSIFVKGSYYMISALIGKPRLSPEELGLLLIEALNCNIRGLDQLIGKFLGNSFLEENYRKTCLYSFLNLDWNDERVEDIGAKLFMKAALDRRRSGLTERSNWSGSMKLPTHFYDAAFG